jgi:rubrerythrin
MVMVTDGGPTIGDGREHGRDLVAAAEELHRIEAFLTHELAAAARYHELAELVDDDRGRIFRELAATEQPHADHWS